MSTRCYANYRLCSGWLGRVACLFLSGLAAVAQAELPAIELTGLSRYAAQAGAEEELKVTSGNHLVEIDQLRFSDPRITAEVVTDDPLPWSAERRIRSGEFRVKFPADLPPGRYEVSAGGRHGISNPRAFLVSTLPQIVPAEHSTNPETPVALPSDALLHGQAAAASDHFYALRLAAGTRYRIDLLAHQLDSRMIGQLQLMDGQGVVVADARGSGDADPHLIVDVPTDGVYLLAIKDFLYRGGDGFHYLVCLQNAETAVDLLGPVPANAPTTQIPRQADPSAVVLATTAARDAPPTKSTSSTESVTIGDQIVATFTTRDHEDAYRFSVDEDAVVGVEVFSHRLGEPADPRLVVEREESSGDSKQWVHLTTADDIPASGDPVIRLASRDAVTTFSAVAGQAYRLRVRDLDDGTALGAEQDYWLDVREATPDFVLLAYRPSPVVDADQSRPVGSNLLRGGVETIRVAALRRDGWTGPIAVTVGGLPDGVTCGPAIMAANQNTVQLTLVADVEAAAWSGPLEVLGRPAGAAEEAPRRAVPATVVRGETGGMELDARLSVELLQAVSGKDVAPLLVELGEGDEIEAKRGSTVKVPIRLTRRDGGKEAVLLRPRDLPPGVSAPEVTAPAEATEFSIDVSIAGGAPLGAYTFWLQGETGVTRATNPQALERATAYRDMLVSRRDNPEHAAEKEQIEAALATAEQLIEAAKPQAASQRVVAHIPTTPMTLRIVE